MPMRIVNNYIKYRRISIFHQLPARVLHGLVIILVQFFYNMSFMENLKVCNLIKNIKFFSFSYIYYYEFYILYHIFIFNHFR